MWDKIKPFLNDDSRYYTVLLLIVAALSYGLGLLSGDNFTSNNGPATVSMTPSPLEREIRPAVTENTQEIKPTPEVKAATLKSPKVYVGSKNSDKFHLPECSGAKRIKEENQIWFSSKDEALAAGYLPAANCPGL